MRVARVLSAVGHPVTLMAAFVALLGWLRPAERPAALVAGLVLLGLPALALALGRARGWWSSLDLPDRRERWGFLPVALVASLAARAAAARVGPHVVVGTVLTLIATWLALDWLITFWWKVSLHAGAAMGLPVFTAAWMGQPAPLAFVLLALGVGWSRRVLGRHTTAQVVAGWLLGGLLGLGFGLVAHRLD
jgi:membrane-associated phospholipid phosphatase